jgi:superfamily II DNA or RNA helicase
MTAVVRDSRVRVCLEGLPEEAGDRIRAAFTHPNPRHGDLRRPDEPRFLRTWRNDRGMLTVPRGGWRRVRDALPGASFADAWTWRHPERDFPDHLLEARDYQREMIDAAAVGETGILRAPTGSGKTTAAFGLLARLKRRALVLVWTKNLFEQWRERAGAELGLTGDDVGIIHGSTTRIRPLTIAMQQTVHSRFKRDLSLAGEFDVVVADEIQRAAADTMYAAIDPFSARYRIGISADETRRDRMEQLTYDLFGDVLHSVDNRKLIDSGAVVDVEMLVVPTDFRAGWYRFRQDFNRLLAQMTTDPDRNALLLDVARRIVSQGQQCLIFTHRVEHARDIDARLTEMGIRSGTLIGGVENEIAFERSKTGLKSGAARAGVGTYGAIAQGLDLPTVARGICATPIGNNRQQMGQVRGRLCREPGGKGIARLVYLLDRQVYGTKPVRNFLDWYGVVRVLEGREWIDGAAWLNAQKGNRR